MRNLMIEPNAREFRRAMDEGLRRARVERSRTFLRYLLGRTRTRSLG